VGSVRVGQCALLAFWVIAWLFFGFALWGVASVADEASKQAAVESQQRMVKVEQDRRDNQRVQLARRQLASNQGCVGGVVVVSGSSYSQLGTVGDPVRCNGWYADRPIR
jgi:hypothetical protein